MSEHTAGNVSFGICFMITVYVQHKEGDKVQGRKLERTRQNPHRVILVWLSLFSPKY